MKTDFKSWFAGLPQVAGMLACGVIRPNGRCLIHSGEKNLPEKKIEPLMRRFIELHEPLASTGLSPRWSTWAFEYGHLRFVPHPDNWLLLLIAAPETEAAQKLNEISGEFLAQSLK
jgi:hypothetical protein